MRIEDSSAIVAGGASGLGEATVRALHARGARVTIADVNAEKGEALASELGLQFACCDVREEEARIVERYPIPSLHEVYRTDLPCRDESDEAWCVERTVRHFLAIEALFERLDPDVVLPEVGDESNFKKDLFKL